MRNNLLSLQQTAKLQDLTQNRLATGLKVNSAIDNPSSYYTAQSLNNRAEDLNVLLDAMSQGIQTLKAVNESIEAGTRFLEQAKSVAGSALETAQPVVAKVSTEAELLAAIDSGKKGLIVLTSDITMSTNQNIVLNDGQSLVGARYLDKNAAQTKINMSINQDNQSAVTVSDNSILADLEINIDSQNTNNITCIDLSNLATASLHNIAVNFKADKVSHAKMINGEHSKIKLTGKINLMDLGAPSANAGGDNIGILGLYAGDYELVDNARLNIMTKTYGGDAVHVANVTAYDNSQINIKNTDGQWGRPVRGSVINLHGKSSLNINSSTESILESIINLYDESSLISKNYLPYASQAHSLTQSKLNLASDKVRVILQSSDSNFMAFGVEKSSISAVAGAAIVTNTGTWVAQSNVENLQIAPPGSSALPGGYFNNTDTTASTMPSDFNDKFDDFEAYAADNNPPETSSKSTETSASQFNQILTQYDNLINDSWYKGVNLLKSQDLKVVFNESRTSDLDIKGVDATTAGLGLETADWSNTAGVQNSLDQIDSAINQLRLYASEFGNYYQIVTTRENFTNSLINVLTEGADQLTLADMNQESANMLALQTRQQLAVNSLSLASQASQSVLKLF